MANDSNFNEYIKTLFNVAKEDNASIICLSNLVYKACISRSKMGYFLQDKIININNIEDFNVFIDKTVKYYNIFGSLRPVVFAIEFSDRDYELQRYTKYYENKLLTCTDKKVSPTEIYNSVVIYQCYSPDISFLRGKYFFKKKNFINYDSEVERKLYCNEIDFNQFLEKSDIEQFICAYKKVTKVDNVDISNISCSNQLKYIRYRIYNFIYYSFLRKYNSLHESNDMSSKFIFDSWFYFDNFINQIFNSLDKRDIATYNQVLYVLLSLVNDNILEIYTNGEPYGCFDKGFYCRIKYSAASLSALNYSKYKRIIEGLYGCRGESIKLILNNFKNYVELHLSPEQLQELIISIEKKYCWFKKIAPINIEKNLCEILFNYGYIDYQLYKGIEKNIFTELTNHILECSLVEKKVDEFAESEKIKWLKKY